MTTAVGPLDPAAYRELVDRAIREDVGSGDITTNGVIEPDQRARASIVVKSRCVLAGLDVAIESVRRLDPDASVSVLRHEGEMCEPGTTVAEFTGSARALLTAERTALNFMQRLSGIATLTRQFVEAAGGRIVVLDTRKTTPTLRGLEKHAVRVGGGTNHRSRLDEAVLIKDNHVLLAGGVGPAVARVRAASRGASIEVEAQDLAQVDAALEAAADVILLDNLSTADITEAVRRCRGRARTEISGGVTLARMPELAATGADFVSVGALTHSAPAADISFDVVPA